MNRTIRIICLFSTVMPFSAWTQTDSLSLADIVRYTLENNFDIKLAENSTERAENRTTIFNTNQLPSVYLDGSANYALDNTTANFQDGRSAKVSSAPSRGAQLGLNVDYTIFDGFIRKHTIEQLKRRFELSELQLKAVIENTLARALSQYYQMALVQNNLKVMEDMLDLSKKRLERAGKQYEFGQSNRLAVLNAEVDLNNDSLAYINTALELDNIRRSLNNVMAIDSDTSYFVGISGLSEVPVDRSRMIQNMYRHNTELDVLDKNIQLGEIEFQLAEARRLPVVLFSGRYDYSYNKNNPAAFLASQNTYGLRLGVTARWNIFDGGSTRTAIEDARLNQMDLALQKEQTRHSLEFEFNNAWAEYENARFVLKTALKNLDISQLNFERSMEEYNIGQLNSIEFRQAQLNLSNARIDVNNARFELRIAETQLLLLSGELLESLQ